MREHAGTAMGRAMAWVMSIIYALAMLNAAGFAVITWLLKPFWMAMDTFVERALGQHLPWLPLIFVLAVILTSLFGLGLARTVRGIRARKLPLVWALFCPVALGVALLADGLLLKLFEELEKDRMMLAVRAVECAPYVAVAAGLAFVILILPRFSFWRSARARWRLFLLSILVVILAVYKPWPPRIVAGPWLTLSGNDGITVSWVTDRPTVGWVEYGPNLARRAHSFHWGLNDDDSRLHRVTLKGLEPGADVSYRVVSRVVRGSEPYSARLGFGVASNKYIFKAPDPNAEEVSFLLFSDLHESFNLLPDLLKAAGFKKRAFVVLNGDTIFQVHSEYQVLRFLKTVSRQFAAEVPFVFVRGNHDASGDFARKLPDYVGFTDRPFTGFFRIGPAAMLFLDTGDFMSSDKSADYPELMDFGLWEAQQTEMLNVVVSSSLWTSAPFRIMCAHIPLGEAGNEWWPLLEKGGVDIQLAGHQHTTQLMNKRGGFPVFIVSGESWFKPESYSAYVVSVNRRQIVVTKIMRTGEQTGEWEFRPRPGIR